MAVWQEIKTKDLSYGLRLDPEFYRPEYANSRGELEKIGTKTIAELKEDIRYGLQADPEYLREGVNYIRALNLGGIGIEGDILKIAESQMPSSDYLAKEGDILITRSGANCGDTGIIENGFIGATYGSYIIRIRLQKVNPFFVYAFLQTKYGKFQTNQIRTGLAQPNLSIPYIEHLILIPSRISGELQDRVESIIKSAFEQQRSIAKLYQEAEQELLERMEWDKVVKSHAMYYEKTSNDVRADERLDAEFYQPKFENLERHLKKTGAMKLGEFCTTIRRGASPVYVEDGNISVVNSQNLSANGIIHVDDLVKTSAEFYENEKKSKARLSQFDVLVYATGAYIGRANCWLETLKAVAGIDCLIIQPQKDVCNPVYLSLFLNSTPGLMQANQRASGSSQRHLYPNDLSRYSVFIPHNKSGEPDLLWQKKLADKIILAHTAKTDAKRKLEEAKQLVEKEIEKLIRT